MQGDVRDVGCKLDPWVGKTPWRILAWRIPRTEEPGGLQSMGSQRVGRDWSDLTLHTLICLSLTIHKHKVGQYLPPGQKQEGNEATWAKAPKHKKQSRAQNKCKCCMWWWAHTPDTRKCPRRVFASIPHSILKTCYGDSLTPGSHGRIFQAKILQYYYSLLTNFHFLYFILCRCFNFRRQRKALLLWN